jgi:RNA polymerase subunit RPABC4/transcription elongation factor Spt4
LLDVALIIIAFAGAFLAALWLSLVIWTFRDIRGRTRDIFAQILAALVVAILNLPGLLIYVMLRPRETLAEAYERSLEEEALLQGIEEVEECPGCGGRVHPDYIICPTCHTKLKRACAHCGKPLNLRWTICPYCSSTILAQAAPAPAASPPVSSAEPRRAQRASADEPLDT